MSSLSANDLLKKVRKIEIKTRALSHQIFAGEYHSAFKGRGMAFSEVREYQYGDDVRNMDWNVTARLRAPYVKVFEEERELTVVLLVDVSRSRLFGTVGASRKDMLAEIAAVLSFSAIINNDKVGALFFSDKVEKFIPPKKGRSHILMIIRSLIEFTPQTEGTALSEAVRYMTNVNKKRCTTFILSDFINPKSDMTPLEDALKIATSRHDLVAIRVSDPRDKELPNVGIIEMRDAESGQKLWIDSSSIAVREHWAERWQQREEMVSNLLLHNRIDTADLTTDSDYVAELIKLFKKR